MSDGQAPDIDGSENTEADVTAQDAAPAAPDPKVSELEAQLAKATSELERARNEAAERRVKLRDESEARAKALAEQGEYKALAEELRKINEEQATRLEGLEALKAKALAFEELEAAELAAIEAAKADLPDEAKAALDAVSDLKGKKAVLAALSVAKGPGAKVAAAAGGGSPAASDKAVSFDGLQGRALMNAIKKDPQAFWGSQQGTSGAPVSALGRMMHAARQQKG